MVYIPVALRDEVKERADGYCEYCQLPEQVAAYPFHIEHIISLKHDGTTESSNLAWACFQCNVSKGTDVAGYDPTTGELVPFFNPRQDEWDQHFTTEEGRIVGISPVGRTTATILQFNHPERVETREQLLKRELWPK